MGAEVFLAALADAVVVVVPPDEGFDLGDIPKPVVVGVLAVEEQSLRRCQGMVPEADAVEGA